MARLATVEDVEARIGRNVADEGERRRIETLLDDASAAVRTYTGRTFGQLTVTVRRVSRGWWVDLPADTTAVVSVEDMDGVTVTGWQWDGSRRMRVGAVEAFDVEPASAGGEGVFDVTITRGAAGQPPQTVRAIVAQMAARAFGRPADQSGVQQESIAGYSYSVGSAAAAGGVGMLEGERTLLDRFRRRGGTAWVSVR